MSPRITILGTGAIGGCYGARLFAAGNDVHFVLRSDYEPVRQHGLRVRLRDSELRVPGTQAHADAASAGPADIVLIGLKATANAELPHLLPPLLKPGTCVINLQNGLGCDEAVAAVAGAANTVGALCAINVQRIGAGEIVCTLPGQVVLGEISGAAGARLQQLAERFNSAGIRTSTTDDMLATRWKKLLWNVPFNGLAVACGGLSTDRILADETLVARARALMLEVIAAARADHVTLDPALIETQFKATAGMGAFKPSTLVDHELGRAMELEPIWGEPLRRARAAGIATPELQSLYAALRAAADPKNS